MQWLSEYTDRSEPTVSESPADIAERLGVPLVGGGQDRNIGETVARSVPRYMPVAVCAKCGRVIFSAMGAVCPINPCVVGLGSSD